MMRSKSVALGFLLGTLVCGGALGFSLDRVLSRENCDAGSDRQAVRAYMASRLQLSASQRDAVDSLLDIRHREMSKIVAPVKPQLDSVREATRAQIKRLLDPTQQQRFQEWVDESKKEESKQQ